MKNTVFVMLTTFVGGIVGGFARELTRSMTDTPSLQDLAYVGGIVLVMSTSLNVWQPKAHAKLRDWLMQEGD